MFPEIGNILLGIGEVILAAGFIYMVLIWLTIDPAAFLIGVFLIPLGLFLFLLDFTSYFEKFYPSIVIMVIGLAIGLIGDFIGGDPNLSYIPMQILFV